ncbi:hypothetical protein JV35_02050 [Pectobacterium betavasculorum]|uniref:Uncharacterized protein n=1 Tax=Pectobacterium betavasculorum TaxID=55207 RepID=A0ABR4V349_9GAMM|nr:hypothetical protein JV35_02050 [Pectobacterium betavasculorum]
MIIIIKHIISSYSIGEIIDADRKNVRLSRFHQLKLSQKLAYTIINDRETLALSCIKKKE